jgi:uncharacterized glyoxalase superfamily protein PhnB
MTTLTLDALTLGVTDVAAAKAFYTTAFELPVLADHGQFVSLGLGPHAAPLSLYAVEALAADAQTESAGSGFRGLTVSYLVQQPSEVDLLVDRATAAGAEVIKPAKKSIWGGYGAVIRVPDGTVWKLVTPNKKGGPADAVPEPVDVAVLIGVTDVKRSTAFYRAVGAGKGRAFGGKYADFSAGDGADTLALYGRAALADDAGVPADGSGFRAVTFSRIVESPGDVDALLDAAAAAGGEITVKPEPAEWGGYAGYFADPDGFLWKVASA